MNNFLRILSLSEDDMRRVTFITPREEGGINSIYDPEKEAFSYQVFIHSRLPYNRLSEWLFSTFSEARSFAARKFDANWEFLSWDQKVKRPCEEGGTECGSGSCPTCASFKEAGEEPSTGSGCGGCGHA